VTSSSASLCRYQSPLHAHFPILFLQLLQPGPIGDVQILAYGGLSRDLVTSIPEGALVDARSCPTSALGRDDSTPFQASSRYFGAEFPILLNLSFEVTIWREGHTHPSRASAVRVQRAATTPPVQLTPHLAWASGSASRIHQVTHPASLRRIVGSDRVAVLRQDS